MLLFFAEEECYHCLASLVAAKEKVFITQTKLLYEVTWKTVMQIAKKHAVRSIFKKKQKYFLFTSTINHARVILINYFVTEISCSPFATNLSRPEVGTNFYGLELVDIGRIAISSSS